MRCSSCNYKFARFEYFVISKDDNGKPTCMCEQCFFQYALDKLNFKSVKMDYDCKNYCDLDVGDFEAEDEDE